MAEGGLGGLQARGLLLGADPEDVSVREVAGIDFKELLLRLDTGSSVYMTLKPRDGAAR